jgi:Thioesterase-like superfamily
VPQAVFLPSGEAGSFTATELARGPWDPEAQHGGAPAALLVRALEALLEPSRLPLVRVTFELLRPVPLTELRVQAEVVRPGRRVQLLEASLFAGPVEVVRARGLALVAAQAPASAPEPVPLPDPAQCRANDWEPRYRPMFSPDAIEIRFAEGGFDAPGGSKAWFRLHVPLVAGEEPSPLQRLAAAADFGNGIAAPVPWNDYVFINPDLTMYVERPPEGEWIALAARSRVADGGIGISETRLFDHRGPVGRGIQALLVAPRPT